jgi:hypothetical protein
MAGVPLARPWAEQDARCNLAALTVGGVGRELLARDGEPACARLSTGRDAVNVQAEPGMNALREAFIERSARYR